MSFREKIIEEMKKRGYFYDELNSHPHYLCFNYDGMVLPMSFSSWKEVDEWVKNVDEV